MHFVDLWNWLRKHIIWSLLVAADSMDSIFNSTRRFTRYMWTFKWTQHVRYTFKNSVLHLLYFVRWIIRISKWKCIPEWNKVQNGISAFQSRISEWKCILEWNFRMEVHSRMEFQNRSAFQNGISEWMHSRVEYLRGTKWPLYIDIIMGFRRVRSKPCPWSARSALERYR